MPTPHRHPWRRFQVLPSPAATKDAFSSPPVNMSLPRQPAHRRKSAKTAPLRRREPRRRAPAPIHHRLGPRLQQDGMPACPLSRGPSTAARTAPSPAASQRSLSTEATPSSHGPAGPPGEVPGGAHVMPAAAPGSSGRRSTACPASRAGGQGKPVARDPHRSRPAEQVHARRLPPCAGAARPPRPRRPPGPMGR